MTTPIPPDRAFTSADAADLGVARAALRGLVAAGVVRRVLHDAYVPGDWPLDVRTLARAAARVLPPHCVVVDRSAAWLHGVDCHADAEMQQVPLLEVASIGGAPPTSRPGVLGGKRALREDEIMVVEGVRVTTPLRTACDIGCLRGRRRSFAVMEEFATKHGVTAAEIAPVLPRHAGRRGCVQLGELHGLIRVGADSPAESWIAIEAHDEGFPMPAAQAWVIVPGWGRAKIENAWEHLKIAVEYDGVEHHTLDDDVARDRARRAALADDGWVIIVVRKDGFVEPGRTAWLAELSTAFAARSPVPLQRRIYSRGPETMVRRRARRR